MLEKETIENDEFEAIIANENNLDSLKKENNKEEESDVSMYEGMDI